MAQLGPRSVRAKRHHVGARNENLRPSLFDPLLEPRATRPFFIDELLCIAEVDVVECRVQYANPLLHGERVEARLRVPSDFFHCAELSTGKLGCPELELTSHGRPIVHVADETGISEQGFDRIYGYDGGFHITQELEPGIGDLDGGQEFIGASLRYVEIAEVGFPH